MVADLSDPTFWIPTLISLALVVITYLDMRRRIRQEERASKSMLELIALLRQQLSSAGSTSQQQLTLRERELKMREAMNTIKTIKWLAETARSLGLIDQDED